LAGLRKGVWRSDERVAEVVGAAPDNIQRRVVSLVKEMLDYKGGDLRAETGDEHRQVILEAIWPIEPDCCPAKGKVRAPLQSHRPMLFAYLCVPDSHGYAIDSLKHYVYARILLINAVSEQKLGGCTARLDRYRCI